MVLIVAGSSVADAVSSHQTSSHKTVSQRPQFARGLGPHVDSFVLSQREEQRKKELSYKVWARLPLPVLRTQCSITRFVGGVGKSDNREEVAA